MGAELAFARTTAAGASAVRIAAAWQALAAYRWESLDRQVRLTVEHGLEPIVSVQSARPGRSGPSRASADRTRQPTTPSRSPRARRYDGTSADLPHVPVWQDWNEPNKVSSPALRRRLGHVVSTDPVRFWVTEFGWDTNPPDPKEVPLRLHARWVAEALYRMWDAGVSLVTWYLLRDYPIAQKPYQSGLYLRGATLAADRPKPSLTAFRFPFVALPTGGRILLWGCTPGGKPGAVVVEQRASAGWTKRVTLEANRFGIFSAEVQAAGAGDFRASLADGSASSVPFALKSPPASSSRLAPEPGFLSTTGPPV